MLRIDSRERLCGPLPIMARVPQDDRPPGERAREQVEHTHWRKTIEFQLLWHIAHRGSILSSMTEHRQKMDGAGMGNLPEQHSKQCRFSCAIGPDHRGQFTTVKMEANVL